LFNGRNGHVDLVSGFGNILCSGIYFHIDSGWWGCFSEGYVDLQPICAAHSLSFVL
jgi:hypothetical protein